MQKRCCVSTCSTTRNDEIALHGFPHPTRESKRFNTWIHQIGGDILNQDREKLFRNWRICHRHFESKYAPAKHRLFGSAIPTLNLPGQKPVKEELKYDIDKVVAEFSWQKPSLECDDAEVPAAAQSDQDKEMTGVLEKEKHSNKQYLCNLCGDLIGGCRFVCCECALAAACGRCESSHGGHLMLRVPPLAVPEEVLSVVDAVRSRLTALRGHMEGDPFKLEVKQETHDKETIAGPRESYLDLEDALTPEDNPCKVPVKQVEKMEDNEDKSNKVFMQISPMTQEKRPNLRTLVKYKNNNNIRSSENNEHKDNEAKQFKPAIDNKKIIILRPVKKVPNVKASFLLRMGRHRVKEPNNATESQKVPSTEPMKGFSDSMDIGNTSTITDLEDPLA